jgi:hypothetical protein
MHTGTSVTTPWKHRGGPSTRSEPHGHEQVAACCSARWLGPWRSRMWRPRIHTGTLRDVPFIWLSKSSRLVLYLTHGICGEQPKKQIRSRLLYLFCILCAARFHWQSADKLFFKKTSQSAAKLEGDMRKRASINGSTLLPTTIYNSLNTKKNGRILLPNHSSIGHRSAQASQMIIKIP